jgi:GNAT superfamily N-acetyltransferase
VRRLGYPTTIDGKTVELRGARADEIVDLRHAELRQGLPRNEAIFPGDELPTTRHYGAFCDGVAVGCATLLQSQWEAEPAWQLRGMATTPAFRGKGLGRAVLSLMEREFQAAGHPDRETVLWCNARTPAVGFYEAMGWRVVSDTFEIPTAGPHVKMVKRLQPGGG